MEKALDLFHTGGIFMYPLSILSIITVAIIIERVVTEFPWRKKVNRFITRFEKGTVYGDGDIPHWHLDDSVYSLNSKRKEIVITEKLQAIFDRRMRVNEVITSIGNTAPLLGFIGTVSGMIGSFDAIANADRVSIKLVASGISEALITTGYGLLIAVFCILADSLLRFWFVKFSHDTEELITNIIKVQNNREE